ncbi:hypothetical protein [Photobacterium leiognathi]|uniref:hypothetical protein n=1 Tax=Photobacterium leiognathi TaxID=553611 RepID=UPI0029812095|nr:hypothetical protein [Photobacterium leiognathi]
MKSTKPITKARNAKIERMKAIKAAYLEAMAEGSIKTYRITRIRQRDQAQVAFRDRLDAINDSGTF